MKHLRIIILIASLLLASACHFHGDVNFDFQHPERYTTGDAIFEQEINAISIDWFSGSIDILNSDNPTGHAEALVPEELSLRTSLVVQVVKTPRCQYRRPGFNPWSGN